MKNLILMIWLLLCFTAAGTGKTIVPEGYAEVKLTAQEPGSATYSLTLAQELLQSKTQYLLWISIGNVRRGVILKEDIIGFKIFKAKNGDVAYEFYDKSKRGRLGEHGSFAGGDGYRAWSPALYSGLRNTARFHSGGRLNANGAGLLLLGYKIDARLSAEMRMQNAVLAKEVYVSLFPASGQGATELIDADNSGDAICDIRDAESAAEFTGYPGELINRPFLSIGMLQDKIDPAAALKLYTAQRKFAEAYTNWTAKKGSEIETIIAYYNLTNIYLQIVDRRRKELLAVFNKDIEKMVKYFELRNIPLPESGEKL